MAGSSGGRPSPTEDGYRWSSWNLTQQRRSKKRNRLGDSPIHNSSVKLLCVTVFPNESLPRAASSTPIAIGTRASFVDSQGPTLHVLSIKARDRLLGLIIGRHLNESESSRLSAELVGDDLGRCDLSEGLESLQEFTLGDLTR